MWTTLALAAVLGSAAAQSDQLALTNVRATYGFLGPERHDNKLLPGDSYYLDFDIEGVRSDAEGKVLYSMGMEVTNNKGKVMYGRDPRDLIAYNSLGGSRLPASTYIDVAPDQQPGEYTIKVTVTDRTTKASQVLKRSFEVISKDFGLVKMGLSYDPEGHFPAPPRGVSGQSLWVNFGAIGFQRDPQKKQPDIAVQMRIVDENGKPTVEKGFPGEVNQLDERYILVPMSFNLVLNRPGRFTVELLGTDRLAKKTSKLSFPLTVTEQKASESGEQK